MVDWSQLFAAVPLAVMADAQPSRVHCRLTLSEGTTSGPRNLDVDRSQRHSRAELVVVGSAEPAGCPLTVTATEGADSISRFVGPAEPSARRCCFPVPLRSLEGLEVREVVHAQQFTTFDRIQSPTEG